ncbi:MAG: MFS transporter [Proteobacteria bacterium]|nr:MFS transporter [Pseudomonadota bacterium]
MNKRFINLGVLYLAQAIPLYFCTFALPTVLRAEGISLQMIGMLGLLLLPWVVKFMWAPFVDRYYIKRIGKRKSWFMGLQFVTIVMLLIFSLFTPREYWLVIFLLAFLLSAVAATQDIAIDGFLVEQLDKDHFHWGNLARVAGTTLGSMLGGALLISLYHTLGWQAVTSLLAVLCVFIVCYMFFITENKNTTELVQEHKPSLMAFFKRRETKLLLLICLIYRACEGLVMGMQSAFLVDLEIPLSTIGIVMGIGSAVIGLVGATTASCLFKPLGGMKMLGLLAIIRGVCYFSLGGIALSGINSSVLIFSVVLVNMASRLMEMVVLYTIFTEYCSKKQAGTDFTVLVCAELLIYISGMIISGFLAAHLGYGVLFTLGGLLSIPGALFALYFLKKLQNGRNTCVPDHYVFAKAVENT